MSSKFLYLAIDLAAISVPLAASFKGKKPFFKKWRYAIPSILLTAGFFLIWDEVFTQLGVWGFNNAYVTGLRIGSLPIEEALFFFCIPYACLFLYHALNELIEKDWLFPHQEIISSVLIVGSLLAGLHHMDKSYTATTLLLLGAFLTLMLLKIRGRYMGRFYLAFFVTLLPFAVVNGILTGAFIQDEVVWYNDAQTVGLRIGTIPLEDVFYAMLMLILNVSLYEYLQTSPVLRPRQNKKVTGAFR